MAQSAEVNTRSETEVSIQKGTEVNMWIVGSGNKDRLRGGEVVVGVATTKATIGAVVVGVATITKATIGAIEVSLV